MEQELAASPPDDGAHQNQMRGTLSRPTTAQPQNDPSVPLHHAHAHAHHHQHDPIHPFTHLTDPALLGIAPPPSTDFPIDPALGGGVHAVDPNLSGPVGHFHHDLSQAYSISPQHPQHQPHSPHPPHPQHVPPPPQHPHHPQPQPGLPVDQAIDPAISHDEVQPGPSTSSAGSGSKRGSVFEDSDQELKRLAAENSNVPLKELATRVREDENGPKAERARQILGMRWLLTSCERAADTSIAVPRNRVYARYVSMCANERIKPLNPASFGKLVRLMYPEIKTRRLGVRGHSKYHYCGIKLKGDPMSPAPKASQGSASGSEPPPQTAGEDHLINNTTQTPVDGYISHFSHPASNGHTSNASSSRPYSDLSPVAKFLQQEICFPTYDIDEPSSPTKRILLPDITPYAPPDIDHDVSASLAAVYRSHCTSLVECVRYMRLKQFFALFVSFQGTLTAPVQKLFAEPSIAPWIRESDWATYKHMIQLLSPLALQVVPAAVMASLRQFSNSLTAHISTTFSNQPFHVIQAKIEPSAIFCSLLDRLLRVNEAAHAAARILVHGPDRSLMRQDWRKYVNCKAIVDREVPCSASAVQRILEDEIINLLQPQPEAGRESTPSPGGDDDLDSLATTESVLDRWTQFLAQLPHRFPNISPRLFMLSVGAVASSALRDLTMAGGESFGGWWVVRCWVDEWIAWTAERGGFLRHGEEELLKDELAINNHNSVHDGGGTNSESELGPDDSGVSLREEMSGSTENLKKVKMEGVQGEME